MSDLLTMSSGIPDSAEDDLVGDVAREVFEVAASSDLLADAGVVFSYSNLAYAVAGYVAVLATGGTIDRLYDGYADLLVRRVLDPIGMTDATVRFSEATTAPDVSKSYEVVDGAAAELAPEDFDGDPLAPSGSVKAGALEMGMFLQTQLSGGIAPDGRRVVSEQNLLITRQPRLDGYAMGWELAERADTPLLSHEGAFDGFMSVIAIAPDLGFGFAILANSEAAADLVAQAPGVFVDLALGSG
jgi:CubicO group peptidase (beta-lactamase class C family)